MRIIKALYILPLGLMIVALACYAIPLPGSFPQPWASERNLFAALVTGSFGLGSMVLFALFAGHEVWRAACGFNSSLAGLGLSLRKTSFFARHYRGLFQDKLVEITLRPAYRLEPWRIEMTLQTSLNIYLAIGNHKPLLASRDCSPITAQNLQFEDLHIYAENEPAATRLLNNPKAYNPLQEFLNNLGGVTGWELYLEFDQIRVDVRTYHPLSEQVTGWIAALSEFAGTGESKKPH